MAYQSLARKWRPQTFDDVLGQPAVTRTLRNALTSRRIAQAFVFAGPRGCGKTTTARILARALNCAQGPTPTPCGTCEACIEIAEGRDIDVLEIDAATHTGVDNVREVIIEGLSIAPARNRYKVFLIDEVHMLSNSSFNALLKSIEEPPPHVVFMMATTELHKIPDTVLSRSQVYEFRTISSKTVADRLRAVADAEGIAVPDDALLLLARAGEGSMRDSLSAFDQVRAFSGDTLTIEDVTSVLGLVGRDLVFDIMDAIAAEDAAAAFALVETAIERGYDLRLLCRELARASRDLLVVSVDPGRLKDPDIASEGERPRMAALGPQFSREDLLRTFDGFTRAEFDVRQSDHPRFQMEMALLRLMHLRKLVPLADLLMEGARGLAPGRAPARPAMPAGRPAPSMPLSRPATPSPAARPSAPAPPRAAAPPAPADDGGADAPAAGGDGRERFLAAVKAAKVFFYNAAVAQAYAIDVTPSGITFAFLPKHKMARAQCEENRAWLEGIAEKTLGRPVPVSVKVVEGDAAEGAGGGAVPAAAAGQPVRKGPAAADGDDRLKAEAMADPMVQSMLEIFPVDTVKVEEM
ncbi:MAG: DNA polymerase III subunit gamma/tau [Vicinamibacterales bacterium]